MSKIFKKITSIEPDGTDILDAIKTSTKTPAKKGLGLTSIEEDNVEKEPVPEFITREESNVPEDHKISLSDNDKMSLSDGSKLLASTPLTMAAITEIPIETKSTRWMSWAAILSALIWIAASFSYFYGFFELRLKWTDLSPMQITGLLMAIILPAILLALLFSTFRQLSKLSIQSQKLQRAADQLTQPDDSVIGKTNILSHAIKTEIDSIDARISQALARMGSLEDVLNERTKGLNEATGKASKTTENIATRLNTERLALESIAGTFDYTMDLLSSGLADHTTKLDSSTKLAEQKIQEARISVEGAADRINTVSSVVRDTTIDAASTLTQSHTEIEGLANMIRERSEELDQVYQKHAQDLTGMIAELRDEQQNLNLSLDERLSKMRDMSLSAKVSAESLKEASEAGKNTVEALAEAARITDIAVKQRFSEMENMVKFTHENAANISDQASERVQERLAQTRKEISNIEDEMLAMQSRLAAPKANQEKLALNAPKQPTKKRKSRIKLKPVENEDDPISDKISSTEKYAAAKPATNSQLPNNTLRDNKLNEELDIPDLRTTLVSSPIAYTKESLNLDIDGQYLHKTKASTLKSDKPINLSDDPINLDEADIILPLEPHLDQKSNKKKERSGWRWRDMLGGLERPGAETSSETSNETLNAPPKARDISNERMIASLSALGLSPTAIIDDGCIIEATNTRRAKGAMAMSQSVSRRIGTPIRHLHRSMEENPALKADAMTYVAQFNTRIGAIETDREAIRNSLETDAGRAYLLCDAALNG